MSVEFAITVIPTLLVFGLLTLALGRTMLAGSAVDAVASSAARAASLARTAPQAETDAATTAASVLTEQGLDCQSMTVEVDTSGFTIPVGSPAAVGVTITCVIDLSDLTAVPGMPGSATLTSTFTSALDPFRSRDG